MACLTLTIFQMMDPFNSINDPLFFMHHAAMDQLWTLWQEQDPKNRIYDYSAEKGDKEPLTPATLIKLGLFAPERRAEELMDTQNRDGKGILCFKYEGIPVEKYMP